MTGLYRNDQNYVGMIRGLAPSLEKGGTAFHREWQSPGTTAQEQLQCLETSQPQLLCHCSRGPCLETGIAPDHLQRSLQPQIPQIPRVPAPNTLGFCGLRLFPVAAEGVWFLPQSKKNMRGFCLITWKNINAKLVLYPSHLVYMEIHFSRNAVLSTRSQRKSGSQSDAQTILAEISDTGRFYAKEMTQTFP